MDGRHRTNLGYLPRLRSDYPSKLWTLAGDRPTCADLGVETGLIVFSVDVALDAVDVGEFIGWLRLDSLEW